MKKVVVWLMVAMMAVSVCGCGFSDGVKDGMEAAANKETETEGATEEQTEAEETEVKEPESVPETEAEPEEETPAVSEEQEKAETAQAESINVLMTAPVTKHEEKNDTKWAEVVVSSSITGLLFSISTPPSFLYFLVIPEPFKIFVGYYPLLRSAYFSGTTMWVRRKSLHIFCFSSGM